MSRSGVYGLVFFCIFAVVIGGTIREKKGVTNPLVVLKEIPGALQKLAKFRDESQRNTSDDDIGECFPNPCLNYGTCRRKALNQYICDCLPFLTGQRCGYVQCIGIPYWPKFIPQPLYKFCTHPEICVIAMNGNALGPSCVCDDAGSVALYPLPVSTP